jgi:non-ribosomal peptide synthetase component F
MPIGRVIGWLAERDPERPAITFEGRTVTRLDLEQRTNRLARAYQQLGVAQDDFVTIALPNGIEFYEAALAVWKLGATPQPVSARLPRLEVEAIVAIANPKIVVGGEPGSLADRTVLPQGFAPDPSLSDEPLPERVARHWKAPTSGGSTGRPKLIVAEVPGEFDPEEEEGPLVQVARMARDRVHLGQPPGRTAALRCPAHPRVHRALPHRLRAPRAHHDAAHLAPRTGGAQPLRPFLAAGDGTHGRALPALAQ